jgi:ABC-type glycerol-3-phosphate transport system permease component
MPLELGRGKLSFNKSLGSLNGYVLSKWKFRGANTLFYLMLFGMFIPYQSILIPLTQTLSAIGLGGTLLGLVLVHVVYGIPITTLISATTMPLCLPIWWRRLVSTALTSCRSMRG